MLNIEGINFQYYNTGQMALRDVSLEVAEGQRLAIVGPSGCGKTTLVRLMGGLLSAEDGKISGKFNIDPSAKIRFVFQEALLLPWRSAWENVAYGLEAEGFSYEERKKKSFALLSAVGLEGKENYYPEELSVGMRQRINFARALAVDPDILLLDEPFSALDPDTKSRLMADFLNIIKNKGITSIMITHDMGEAFGMATRVAVMSGSPGTVKDIVENDGSLGIRPGSNI
jgi:NitT/TauT family transport system ATP-binding protein